MLGYTLLIVAIISALGDLITNIMLSRRLDKVKSLIEKYEEELE